MELAAPGIKKEYCRVAINDEGRSAEGRLQGKNLTIAIEKGGVHDVDNIEGGHQQDLSHQMKKKAHPKVSRLLQAFSN